MRTAHRLEVGASTLDNRPIEPIAWDHAEQAFTSGERDAVIDALISLAMYNGGAMSMEVMSNSVALVAGIRRFKLPWGFGGSITPPQPRMCEGPRCPVTIAP